MIFKQSGTFFIVQESFQRELFCTIKKSEPSISPNSDFSIIIML